MARCASFSPVPSQTVPEFFGSTTTAPSEYDPPSSNTGAQLSPRLLVFHKPPDAVAVYQTLRLCGSTATSAMRHDEKTPEMFRTGSPLTSSAVSRGAAPCCAMSSPIDTKARTTEGKEMRLIGLSDQYIRYSGGL